MKIYMQEINRIFRKWQKKKMTSSFSERERDFWLSKRFFSDFNFCKVSREKKNYFSIDKYQSITCNIFVLSNNFFFLYTRWNIALLIKNENGCFIFKSIKNKLSNLTKEITAYIFLIPQHPYFWQNQIFNYFIILH